MARAMEGEAVAVDGATHLRRAEDALKAGDALQAAASFAAAGDAAPFESTALGFLDRGEDDALALYLRSRLDAADRAREPETVSKLAAWLADLHVSRACGAERGTPAAEAATKDLRLFFAAHGSRLDKEATKKLLAEFGLADDLAHFAETVGDVREAIELRLERGDVAGTFQTLRGRPSLGNGRPARRLRRGGSGSAFLRSREFLATALGGDAERASECSAKSARRSSSKPTFTSSLDDDGDSDERRAKASRARDGPRGSAMRDGASRPRGHARGVARRRGSCAPGSGCVLPGRADADAAALAAETELLERGGEDAGGPECCGRCGTACAPDEAARDAEMESFATWRWNDDEVRTERRTGHRWRTRRRRSRRRRRRRRPTPSALRRTRRRVPRFPRRTRRGTPRAHARRRRAARMAEASAGRLV